MGAIERRKPDSRVHIVVYAQLADTKTPGSERVGTKGLAASGLVERRVLELLANGRKDERGPMGDQPARLPAVLLPTQAEPAENPALSKVLRIPSSERDLERHLLRDACQRYLGPMIKRQLALALAAFVALPLLAQAPPSAEPRPAPKPQPRPAAQRVAVDPALVRVDDGDTVVIQWSREDAEIVRILGIDTPETQHYSHNLPFDQPFGSEARAYARGAFAAATKIEILRAATLDPFGRSLAYLFINGQNYSLLVLKARLAEESITPYGDNGFPEEAAAIQAAAKAAGPLPFQPPSEFRARMREVTRYLKSRGEYPAE